MFAPEICLKRRQVGKGKSWLPAYVHIPSASKIRECSCVVQPAISIARRKQDHVRMIFWALVVLRMLSSRVGIVEGCIEIRLRRCSCNSTSWEAVRAFDVRCIPRVKSLCKGVGCGVDG